VIWTGEELEIQIRNGPDIAGNLKSGAVKKVFAITDRNGDISVLVANDDGILVWVNKLNYKVWGEVRRG